MRVTSVSRVAAGAGAAEELDELGRRPIRETLGRNIFRRDDRQRLTPYRDDLNRSHPDDPLAQAQTITLRQSISRSPARRSFQPSRRITVFRR